MNGSAGLRTLRVVATERGIRVRYAETRSSDEGHEKRKSVLILSGLGPGMSAVALDAAPCWTVQPTTSWRPREYLKL